MPRSLLAHLWRWLTYGVQNNSRSRTPPLQMGSPEYQEWVQNPRQWNQRNNSGCPCGVAVLLLIAVGAYLVVAGRHLGSSTILAGVGAIVIGLGLASFIWIRTVQRSLPSPAVTKPSAAPVAAMPNPIAIISAQLEGALRDGRQVGFSATGGPDGAMSVGADDAGVWLRFEGTTHGGPALDSALARIGLATAGSTPQTVRGVTLPVGTIAVLIDAILRAVAGNNYTLTAV